MKKIIAGLVVGMFWFGLAATANAAKSVSITKTLTSAVPTTIGDTATWDITVTNTSDAGETIENVEVTDILGAGFEYVDSTENGVNSLQTTIWTSADYLDLGNMIAGASLTMSITAKVTGNVNVDNRADVRFGTGPSPSGTEFDSAVDGGTAVVSYMNDTINPTVAITGVPSTTDGSTAFTATFTFDENVTGFNDVGDVTAINANVGAITFISPTVYRASITPTGLGNVTVDVPANVAFDAADNGNTSAPDVTATLDNSAPTVEILNAPTTLSGVTSFNVTFEFSEDVFLFVLGDITIGNGTASNFDAVDGNTYTADITPTGAGDVTIDVAAGVAQDAAANVNTAAPTVTIGNTIVEDTQKVIANFITNRAHHILNNQPDLISFLDGTNIAGGGPLGNLNLTANSSNMNLAFSSSLSRIQRIAQQRINRAFNDDRGANPAAEKKKVTAEHQTMAYAANWLNKSPTNDAEEKLKAYSKDDEETYAFEGINGFDVWTEVHGSRSVSGTADSSLWVGYVGVHKLINPDLLIGGLLQLDWADETNSSLNSTADGFGWMIGPYIAGRIPGHSLSYEARASWGRSSNDVSPIGTYTDGFDTTRWMASGKIAGSYRIDDLTINPFISAAWFEENQEKYTDSLGNTIPEQTVSLGEIRFGPQLMREIVLENGGRISPSFGVSGVWNFGISDNAASQGNALGDEQLRARFEAGVTATDANGWQLIIAGFYDGVGIDDYYAYGGNARLVIPLP